MAEGDELAILDVENQLKSGDVIKVTNKTKGFDFECTVNFSDRQKELLYAGGLLNYTKNNG